MDLRCTLEVWTKYQPDFQPMKTIKFQKPGLYYYHSRNEELTLLSVLLPGSSFTSLWILCKDMLMHLKTYKICTIQKSNRYANFILYWFCLCTVFIAKSVHAEKINNWTLRTVHTKCLLLFCLSIHFVLFSTLRNTASWKMHKWIN